MPSICPRTDASGHPALPRTAAASRISSGVMGDVGLITENWVVLENSNVEKLASHLYLSVHSLPQEDHHDTDDASAGEIYPILVSESTVCTIQPPRRRQHRASIVDRHTQTHRTAALYSL